mmetsp:Transcript_3036/g.12593  ORF Transcript_3036/g.12593 Transcript_3036/m.12593 type:complete len:273 (+) Transcript_3036:30-848(+)
MIKSPTRPRLDLFVDAPIPGGGRAVPPRRSRRRVSGVIALGRDRAPRRVVRSSEGQFQRRRVRFAPPPLEHVPRERRDDKRPGDPSSGAFPLAAVGEARPEPQRRASDDRRDRQRKQRDLRGEGGVAVAGPQRREVLHVEVGEVRRQVDARVVRRVFAAALRRGKRRLAKRNRRPPFVQREARTPRHGSVTCEQKLCLPTSLPLHVFFRILLDDHPRRDAHPRVARERQSALRGDEPLEVGGVEEEVLRARAHARRVQREHTPGERAPALVF